MIVVKRFILAAKKDQIREFLLRKMTEVGKSPYRKEFRLKKGDIWMDVRVSEKLWNRWDSLPSVLYLNLTVRIPEEGEEKPFQEIYQIDVYAPPLKGDLDDTFLTESELPFLSPSSAQVASLKTDKGETDILIFV